MQEQITIEQFIAKHNIRFECRRVAARPDEMMSDPDGMRHFRCRITSGSHSFSVYFSQGSAHTSNPTLADVLDCLTSDASGYENAYGNGGTHFEQWAEEYGYDTDSIAALKIFKTVKRQAELMKRTLGSELYEELLYRVEQR